MIFHIGERCAGSGHAGNADGRIGAAFFNGGAGLCGSLCDIAHAVQAVLAVFRPVDGNEGIEALLGGHLVIAVRTVENVVEAAVRLPDREKIFRQGMTVFHKAAVSKVNSKLTERDHDLRNGLYVGRSPRCKAALAVLHFGKVGQSLVRCGFDRFLILIFCKRLQCHCGNVHVGIAGAGETPAAVLHLILDDLIDVKLARGLCLCGGVLRNVVIAGIQRDQCPNGAVQPLPDGLFKIAQRGQKVVSRDLGRVAPDGSQRENDAGILGVFSFMQHAGAVLDVLLNARIVIFVVICGNSVTRTGKTDNCPFAADGADLRGFDSGHHIGGAALYFILDARCRQRGNSQRQKDREGQNPCNSFGSSHLYFPL